MERYRSLYRDSIAHLLNLDSEIGGIELDRKVEERRKEILTAGVSAQELKNINPNILEEERKKIVEKIRNDFNAAESQLDPDSKRRIEIETWIELQSLQIARYERTMKENPGQDWTDEIRSVRKRLASMQQELGELPLAA